SVVATVVDRIVYDVSSKPDMDPPQFSVMTMEYVLPYLKGASPIGQPTELFAISKVATTALLLPLAYPLSTTDVELCDCSFSDDRVNSGATVKMISPEAIQSP